MGELEAAPAHFVVDSDFGMDIESRAKNWRRSIQCTVQRGCISANHRITVSVVRFEFGSVGATRAAELVSGSVRHVPRPIQYLISAQLVQVEMFSGAKTLARTHPTTVHCY